MNIFRLAGDMTHLVSVLVLLLKIHTIKSCAGSYLPFLSPIIDTYIVTYACVCVFLWISVIIEYVLLTHNFLLIFMWVF